MENTNQGLGLPPKNADKDSLWTINEILQSVDGEAYNCDLRLAVYGVSIDSRTIEQGDMFVALTGDTANGHDYAEDALSKGASVILVSDLEALKGKNLPMIVVKDTLKALEDLGRVSRRRAQAHVVAVTGSVGKTSTKEMLALAFQAQDGRGRVHAAIKSFNNHIGVPYTLATMHDATDTAVFEIGMNHANEITPLSRMVRPHTAIITKVAPVHIENFEDEQGIADAKAEIFNGLEQGGLAILNKDNQWFDYLAKTATGLGLRVQSFGTSESADAQLIECLSASNGTRIKAKIGDVNVTFTLKLSGEHFAMNALAVLLAVQENGGDIAKAAKGLERMEAITGRGKREFLDYGDPENPVTLIDESYNASPVAMKAAFKVLAMIDPGRGGRRIAVLGDMLELGKKSAKYHADLALPLQTADVQLVYTCGKMMKNLHDSLPPELDKHHRETSAELAQIVPDVLVPGDVVMVKGSLGSKMGAVVEAMRAVPEKASNNHKTE